MLLKKKYKECSTAAASSDWVLMTFIAMPVIKVLIIDILATNHCEYQHLLEITV